MTKDELILQYLGLARELDISRERAEVILTTLRDLIQTTRANIVVYNTITVNFSEKEQRFAFYVWGSFVGMCYDKDDV